MPGSAASKVSSRRKSLSGALAKASSIHTATKSANFTRGGQARSSGQDRITRSARTTGTSLSECANAPKNKQVPRVGAARKGGEKVDIVEPRRPDTGSLETTAMDFVEPQRPKTGCVITTAMDIVEPLWPETGSVITTAMDIVEPQWPETGSLIKTTAMDIVEPQRPESGSLIAFAMGRW